MDLYNVRKQLSMGISIFQIKLRVTKYVRVSTERYEQKKSLKNQIDHFDDMILNNPNWIYVEGYIDCGVSGVTDFKRDNFMRMIDDAYNDKFDLIVTKEISRFSRNTLDSIKYTRKLLEYGVCVFFVNDNINTAIPDSELRLAIMSSMAQDEIRRLSERVKFGMNAAIKKGKILGNDLLYGYKKDKLTGNLCVVEDEACVVRKLFSDYVFLKKSLNKIAKEFNNKEISTKLGNKFSTSTLSRMISNVKYKGYYCGKKTEIVDYMTKKVKYLDSKNWIVYEDKEKIPPIVSEELWEMANKRLSSRKKVFGSDYKDKQMYKNRYSLSAKIFCGYDNCIFHRRKCKNDISWFCSNYLINGKRACECIIIKQSELYVIFVDILKSLKIDNKIVFQLLLDLYNGLDCFSSKNCLDLLNKNKEKIINKKEKLLELNLKKIISDIEFKIRNDKCNNELVMLNSKINNIDNKFENRELDGYLNSIINSMFFKDVLINFLLERVVVYKFDNDRNRVKLDFYLSDKFICFEELNIYLKKYRFVKEGDDVYYEVLLKNS